ncbi:MAG TPA: hypothetical protein DDX91_01020 [Ruminococcaceae bacterium]|nr:hypothetical protein [Oscillospiraceae bacterium]
MNIKGIVKTVLCIFIGIYFLSAKTYAEEAYNFGQSEMESALPDSARAELEDIGINAESGAEGLSAENVFKKIWDLVCDEAAKPISIFISVTGVIILSALIQSMQGDENDVTSAFASVGVVACAGIICTSFGYVMSAAKIAVEGLSSFLSVYVPVFAGIMAANGQTAAAAAYNGIITVSTELFCQLFSLFIFPLASCIMGISVAGAFNPDLRINSMAEGVKKLLNWCLTFVMTVFVGILSVQSFVGAAADSVAIRAAKFTVSGAVPIVGGAVSEALMTVKGSIGVIKASTGSYGIIASAAVMLPSVISLFLFRLVLVISSALSDTFGTSRITVLLKCGESIISIIIAVMISFWTLGVVSTALMLVIGGGGV